MKRILTIIAVAMIALSASAQIKFGVKGGVNVTKMSLSNSVLDIENRAGFFIGPTVKCSILLVGLGFDLSALYDQREGRQDNNVLDNTGTYHNLSFKQQQIILPLNLRYEIGIGDLASLFVFGGPQVGFNVGDGLKEVDWTWQQSNFSINVGGGLMLAKHFQVTANYNIACGKTGKFNVKDVSDHSQGKLNSWQLGLAYYF